MSESAVHADSPDHVVMVALRQVRIGPSFRHNGVDQRHVNSLIADGGRWPPILVSFSDHTVIDGTHRVHAAKTLGLAKIAAIYFYGTHDDAYLAFVQQNTRHGLPLTLQDRERAAQHVLAAHSTWSDRRIAELCGISARTVAELRSRTPAVVNSAPSSLTRGTDEQAVRIGKDGKRHPLNPHETRERIAAALENNPRGSLRAIASGVGASPETVRSVRARLYELATPANTPPRLHRPPATDQPLTDAALRATPDGNKFLNWFTATNIEDDWRDHVESIPLSRVYEIADQARRRAARWSDFANAVETRSAGRYGR